MAKTDTSKPRCLIVEDDPKWLNALADLMKGMGCDVELASNAHGAIKILEDEKAWFDVLLLDWDLRSTAGTLFPSKVGGDVLDEMPREKRPHIKVVIVTGALDDPEFRNAVDQELNDLHEEIDGFQPFRKILKKRYARHLAMGLGPLRQHFEEIGLTKRSPATVVRSSRGGAKQPKPPFRMDNLSPRFLDKDNRSFMLPVKCHNVLRGLLMKMPAGGGNPAHNRGFLTDNEVCLLYREGPNDPLGAAEQFARALRRYLKDHHGLNLKNSLVKRVRGNGFAIGDDWDETRPIFNASEVSLVYTDSIEDVGAIKHRRPGAPKPSSE